MRIPARVFLRCLSFLLIFFFLLPSFTSITHAQTPTDARYQLIQPNVNSDVPHNQHTFVQSLFLEILLAVQCQLTGIDLSNPTKSCLGLDVQTGKLGYSPPNSEGKFQVGGVLGMLNKSIGVMYTPTFSSQEYFKDVASNFGLVKSTYAYNYSGFEGLSPVLGLWKTMRDISYYLLILAFIFIGIGVMLRLKIDPRTVMTVQNQIPRVIICIILITFSYALAGILIDTMWAVTYMGINRITQAADPRVDCDQEDMHLANTATRFILANPFGFVNQIFAGSGGYMGCVDVWGTLDLSKNVANQIARIEDDMILNFFFGKTETPDCGIFSGAGECFLAGLYAVVNWVVSIIWFIIVFIALMIALFKVWFELLKAYIMILLYTILAPIWIVFGLLPKRPLGFEKWIRVYFANLAIFPAVVFILVGARVLNELFAAAGDTPRFVPPLIGEPSTGSFGAIIEFGMVLMAPQLLSLIREKLSVPPTKQTGAAMQTFNAGRAAAGTPAKQALKHLNKRDQQGNAIGPLAKRMDNVTRGFSRLPVIGGLTGHDKNEWVKQNYSARGYDEAEKVYKQARSSAQSKGPEALKKFDDEHKGSVTQFANNVGFQGHRGEHGGLSPQALDEMGVKMTDVQRQRAARQSGVQDDYGGRSPAEVAAHGGIPPEGAMPTRQPSPSAGTAGAPTPAPTATGGEAAPGTTGRSEVVITIQTPGAAGGQTLTVNPTAGSTRQMHEVLLERVEAHYPENSPERNRLTQVIEAQRTANNLDFTVPEGEVSSGMASRISSILSGRHVNPTATPGEEPGPEGTPA